MSWSKKPEHPDKERGYHHGNLREALVSAALSLIAEKGAMGFTFAEAARAAGVSAAAPYRHFRDRDDLIADVARRGFDELTRALELAWNEGRPDAFTAFEAVGRAYLTFARDEPALYSAMFEAGVPLDRSVELRAAADRAFGVLRLASERPTARMPEGKRPPALMMSLHMWALAHGIATLFCRNDGGRRALPMSPEELVEAGLLVYLQGLGFNGPAEAR